MDEKNSYNWKCRSLSLPLWKRTFVMGILNVTPDSFSDGGRYNNPDQAVRHALQMVNEGADIIDIGGESTRPGANPVSVEEELNRVIPVIERLSSQLPVPISVDTFKSRVASEALAAGAQIVNDISGLYFDAQMADTVAKHNAGCVLMHIKGEPRNMQQNPHYDNLFEEITSYLSEAIEIAKQAGISPEQIVIDPGIGFGKRFRDNLEIIRELGKLNILKRPVLIGPSRKSFLGQILNLDPDQRLEGTAAAIALSIVNGANIIRVHDVKAMKRVALVVDAILESDYPL